VLAVPPADAGLVLEVGDEIRDMVADPVRNDLYASLVTGEIIRVNMETREITDRVFAVDNPYHLATSPDGTKLFVSLFPSCDIAVYSLPSLAYETTYDVSFNAAGPPGGLVASLNRLYIGSSQGGSTIVETDSGDVLFHGLPDGFTVGHDWVTWSALDPLGTDLIMASIYPLAGYTHLGIWDVTTDEPRMTNWDPAYSLGPAGRPTALDITPDGLELVTSMYGGIAVLERGPTGLLDPQHFVWLTPDEDSLVTSVKLSIDATRAFAVSDGNDRALVFLRTSDWFPYARVPILGYPRLTDSLVMSADGSILAVLTAADPPASGHHNDSTQIEFFSSADPTPNFGCYYARGIDSVELQPIKVNVSPDGSVPDDLLFSMYDYHEGLSSWRCVATGSYDFTISRPGYQSVMLPGVSVDSINWTNLGDVIMVRDPGTTTLPLPTRVFGTPATIPGQTSNIRLYGENFLPGISVESNEPTFIVDSWSRIDWSTIDLTITDTSIGPRDYLDNSILVTNPGSSTSVAGDLLRVIPEMPTIHMSEEATTVEESSGSVVLDVERSGLSTGEVTIDYETVDGTAFGGSDFTIVSGTLTWTDGDSSPKTITVPIGQDAISEGPETFAVELSNPIGGRLGSPAATTITIDDDDSSTVQFAIDAALATETDGTVLLTVSRTGDISTAGSVNWSTADGTATAGEDYTSAGGTLDWAAGNGDDKTIMVTILDDAFHEETEAFTVVLSSPGGNAFLGDPSTATVNISDDDVIEIVFSAASFSAGEGDGNATITAWRTGASNGAVTADFTTTDGTATAGSDYTAVGGTLSWADGDITPKTFDIPILEDGEIEIDETVGLILSNPTGGATIGAIATAVFTIEDNDGSLLQLSAATYPSAETGGSVDVTILRIGGSGHGEVSVDIATADGTATAGLDYLAAFDTVTWVDGDTDPKTFSVTLLDDGHFEGPETINVSLNNPVGNTSIGVPANAEIVIDDDEWMERLVNTQTSGPQTRPNAAMNATGDSVVVWESYLQDGSGWGIFGQRFDAAGNPVESEFQVNSGSAGDQRYPAAAMRPDGSFTVVWLDSDGAGDGIRGRSFSGAGAPTGGDFTVNSTITGDQTEPDVAVDGSGAGIVVWQTDVTGDLEIRGRRLDASGAPTGSELTINSTTADDQQAPAIAGAAGGGFAIVWQGYGQDGPADGIIARLFAASGAPTGAEFIINEWTAGNQISPAIGRAIDGSILVAWEDTTNKDGSGSSIRARWFSATGTPLGGDVQANTHWLDDQMNPTVACSGPGNALIAWESEDQDGSNLGIYTQALGHDGVPSGIELRMNIIVIGIQHRPALADSASGAFWATWASGAQDGSGDGIYGLFSAAPVIIELFTDGFESGDTSAWGSTTP